MLTAVAVLLVSTWYLRSFVVVGPSMAQTIMGAHHRLACGACGYEFCCAADGAEMPGRQAICPNCGAAGPRLDTAPRQAADAIVVDRGAFLPRSPRRWELAAFHSPEHASQVYVKRVVGLPGEAIELRHGDVFANGAMQRKNLAELRTIAVPVYDSRYEQDSSAARWQPDSVRSGWRRNGSRYGYIAGAGNRPTIDWLTYHHRRLRSSGEAEESAVLDEMGYNQESPVIESHYVRDLLVSCRLEIANSPVVNWSLTDGISQFLMELDFARGEAGVTQDGRPLGRGQFQAAAEASVLFELAVCDQQVLAALDGRPLLTLPYRTPDVPFRPTSRPVAVGMRNGGLELSDLTLWRDVYYGSPPGKPPGWQARLADDEYFVLGDNSAASLDSRAWPTAGVAASDFVGKPVLAYPCGMDKSGQGKRIQVPSWRRFRYIQ